MGSSCTPTDAWLKVECLADREHQRLFRAADKVLVGKKRHETQINLCDRESVTELEVLTVEVLAEAGVLSVQAVLLSLLIATLQLHRGYNPP